MLAGGRAELQNQLLSCQLQGLCSLLLSALWTYDFLGSLRAKNISRIAVLPWPTGA